MKYIDINFQITEITDVSELSADEQKLVATANTMTEKAYAPYSQFSVGAAILLDNGEIIVGSNQENAAYPSGLCAERVAAFAAASQYPGAIMKVIAISAKSKHAKNDQPVSPCGACRQVLLEYEFKQKKPLKILLSSVSGKIYSINKVKDILPLSFTAEDLGIF